MATKKVGHARLHKLLMRRKATRAQILRSMELARFRAGAALSVRPCLSGGGWTFWRAGNMEGKITKPGTKTRSLRDRTNSLAIVTKALAMGWCPPEKHAGAN